MILTNSEKMKRVEIASDLLEYALMMEDMLYTPKKLIKNIFRDREKKYNQNLYSEQKFEQIKKHHYFSAVTAAFSYIKDEYIEKLNLKNSDINISEDAIKGIFVNPDDIELYRNPSDNNKLKIVEILKYIRNALNHHENDILYKYIESEDVIEINLKNLGTAHNGKTKTLHVKVPIKMLMGIVHTINQNEFKQSKFIYLSKNINYNASDLREELKKNIKILRLIPVKGVFDNQLFKELYTLNIDDIESSIYRWEQEGKIKIREYTYDNGAITDLQIDSICEQVDSSGDYDWRVNKMYDCLSFVNALKLGTYLPNDAKQFISRHLSINTILPFSIVSFDRFDASAIFNNLCLQTWNSSYFRILEQKLNGIQDLRTIDNLDWFILDPVEKVYTEYENFIRYAIVNFAPIGKDNKPLYIHYEGKKYNCTFLRNAFSHGRVSIVKKGGQYLFALSDTPAGLGNEVKYYNDDDFRPKMYTKKELIKLAQYLCISEKQKIEKETPKVVQELGKLKIELLNSSSIEPSELSNQDKKK